MNQKADSSNRVWGYDRIALFISAISLLLALVSFGYSVHIASQLHDQALLEKRTELLRSMFQLRSNLITVKYSQQRLRDILKDLPVPSEIIGQTDKDSQENSYLISQTKQELLSKLDGGIKKLDSISSELEQKISKFKNDIDNLALSSLEQEMIRVDEYQADVDRVKSIESPKFIPIIFYKNGEKIQWPPQRFRDLIE